MSCRCLHLTPKGISVNILVHNGDFTEKDNVSFSILLIYFLLPKGTS